ncbi:gamma-glutamylcyclotransferase family protein [Streptomyces sp. NPDC046887]|uniref:gamma-glutamylcyclotransferase family protein n=1 Tax=Streptomyces sp. NPDC046887 TaxID=3155472 RepID=UPI0033DAFBD7
MTVPDPLGRPQTAPDRAAHPLPFFVYGTLRPGESNHARHLRGRTADEEPARLPGTLLYEGPGYPYLARAGAGDAGGAAGVLGELVTAAPGEYEALLAVLDALEEFLAPGHPLNAYERERCEAVRLADGARVAAWVYVAAPAVRLGAAITGGDWLTRPGRAPLPPPP